MTPEEINEQLDAADKMVGELREALAGLVDCIDIIPNGDPMPTIGPLLGQVCRLLQRTPDYRRAKELLGHVHGEPVGRER